MNIVSLDSRRLDRRAVARARVRKTLDAMAGQPALDKSREAMSHPTFFRDEAFASLAFAASMRRQSMQPGCATGVLRTSCREAVATSRALRPLSAKLP